MGLFSKIKGKRGSQGGVYFKQGLYQVKVNRVKVGKTRHGDEYFAVETEIITSTNPNREPGSNCTWMAMFKHDAALGNIADFARAGLWAFAVQNGADPGFETHAEVEIDEEGVEELCAEDNPIAGVILDIEAVDITTSKGNPFTLVKFSPPKDEEPESDE